jgi:hypothetical protein
VPALYAAERLPGLLAAYPDLQHVAVRDVNHYTIAMSERGADARRRGWWREQLAAVAT